MNVLYLALMFIFVWLASELVGHHGQPTWSVMIAILMGAAAYQVGRYLIKRGRKHTHRD